MKIISSALTNVGKKIDYNEDNFYLNKDENLFLVADGMGGCSSGHIASELIIKIMRDFFYKTSGYSKKTWPYKIHKNKEYEENRLIIAIEEANKKIYERSHSNAKERGMGTTITAILFIEGGVYIAWVGDSRIYRLRDNKLEQLSKDHSLLNEMIKKNSMTEEEIENFPYKNVILRAIGSKPSVEVDVKYYPLRDKDIFLLCTDGLYREVENQNIESFLLKSLKNLKSANKSLVKEANRNGGSDNITSMLVQYFQN